MSCKCVGLSPTHGQNEVREIRTLNFAGVQTGQVLSALGGMALCGRIDWRI